MKAPGARQALRAAVPVALAQGAAGLPVWPGAAEQPAGFQARAGFQVQEGRQVAQSGVAGRQALAAFLAVVAAAS